jgi:hypothetical protein
MSDLGRKGLGEQAQEKSKHHFPHCLCRTIMLTLAHQSHPTRRSLPLTRPERASLDSVTRPPLLSSLVSIFLWLIAFVSYTNQSQRARSLPRRSLATLPAQAATQPRRRVVASSTLLSRVSATPDRPSPTHSTAPRARRSKLLRTYPTLRMNNFLC